MCLLSSEAQESAGFGQHKRCVKHSLTMHALPDFRGHACPKLSRTMAILLQEGGPTSW